MGENRPRAMREMPAEVSDRHLAAKNKGHYTSKESKKQQQPAHKLQ